MFCEDMIIPQKDVKIFPNKPWISKSLKHTINEKKIACQSGSRVERKKKLREEIRKAKSEYKDKVELPFQSGNMRDAGKGLKSLTGQSKTQSTCSMPLEDRCMFTKSLNEFFCRFERDDLKDELSNRDVGPERNSGGDR